MNEKGMKGTMTTRSHMPKRRRRGEEGVILFMVIMLVVMFSGLGLLAMRHTQGELRSANAYMDSTQASAAAESAVMMVATDMRRNWTYPNLSDKCLNYYSRFQQASYNSVISNIQTGFSDVFDTAVSGCNFMGTVPFAGLNGTAALADTGGPLAAGYAAVKLTQDWPQMAPPPPGFSSDDEARNYAWYYFTVTSQAAYGYDFSGGGSPVSLPVSDGIIRGNAVVRSHMKIGPVKTLPEPGIL